MQQRIHCRLWSTQRLGLYQARLRIDGHRQRLKRLTVRDLVQVTA
jgi:hypothetical protein